MQGSEAIMNVRIPCMLLGMALMLGAGCKGTSDDHGAGAYLRALRRPRCG